MNNLYHPFMKIKFSNMAEDTWQRGKGKSLQSDRNLPSTFKIALYYRIVRPRERRET